MVIIPTWDITSMQTNVDFIIDSVELILILPANTIEGHVVRSALRRSGIAKVRLDSYS